MSDKKQGIILDMFKNIKHFVREQIFSRVTISGDSFMYGLLAILVILGPLFFIPVRAFSVSSSKGFLVFFIGILGLLAYGIYVLRKGILIFPRQKIFLTLLLLVLAGVLGAFLSSGFAHAFLGYGFETTSWLFLALFALIIFFSYLVLNSYKRMGMLYGGIFLVFIIFALTHILRYLVGPAFANLGVLGGTTSTLMSPTHTFNVGTYDITLIIVTACT